MEIIHGCVTGWELSDDPRAEHWHKMEMRHILSGWKLAEKITIEQSIILDRLNTHATDIYH